MLTCLWALGSFSTTPTRSPVPEPSGPGLPFLSRPPFPTQAALSRNSGVPPHLGFHDPDCGPQGPRDGFKAGRTEKEDRGLCPQLPCVDRSRRAEQAHPRTSSDLGMENPLQPRREGWARRSRPHCSHRAWRKASRVDPLSDSVQRPRSPSPQSCSLGGSAPEASPRWLERECSVPCPLGPSAPQDFTEGVLTTPCLEPSRSGCRGAVRLHVGTG